MTPKQLAEAVQCPLGRAEKWADPLNTAMDRYEITTPERQAAFLAQVGHESGRLVFVREIWSPAQCPWQAKYEGRLDLGNTQLGDGARFKGRGLIQITGRANYRACGASLELALEETPELLEQPGYAALSAAWFWNTHGCNALADAGDFEHITRKINGGLNGEADRLVLWATAKNAMGAV